MRPEATDVEQRCPMCAGTTSGVQNQPLTDDPAVLDRLLDTLDRKLDDLRGDRIGPEDLRDEVPKLCAGCRGLLSGITDSASREELIQHLTLHRRQIEARVEAMEQNLPPTAEGRPRRRGPSNRAA